MATQLNKSIKIRTLAKDLGIKTLSDPVAGIIAYCEQKIKKFLKDFPDCENLDDLQFVIAHKVGTFFEEIHNDDDLDKIRSKYIQKREKIFVRLKEEFSEEVFGITFKLFNRECWEPEFVSIIDCRGRKALRSYYTKWHEIAHLLVLTDQTRLSFQRSFTLTKDPEESLMDVIAGTFGYYAPLVKKYIDEEISFQSIERLRSQLCPKSSWQASLIGFVKAWSRPCILIHAEIGLRKHEQAQLDQGSFGFCENPVPALRATKVTSNEKAREMGLKIFENMRIPSTSIIYRSYIEETDYTGEEYLQNWSTSDGSRLTGCKVSIEAKFYEGSVGALIVPI